MGYALRFTARRAMTTSALRTERDGAVARVWLDRPEIRNALNATLIGELAAAFAAIAADDGVRAIVVGGSGKAFCAGADLGAMRAASSFTWEENHADASRLAEMLWSLYSCPVPVIARIHGDCYAGGLGIASVCDIRVVADGVTFSLSEARLGLLPATISPYVVRAMGEQAARRWFVTAERFGAAEAKACGFAHEVCAADEIDAVVGRIVDDAGHPLGGVIVDLFDAASGNYAQSAISDGLGYYATAANTGYSYFVATEAGSGHVDQVYAGISCPLGPAYFGSCPLLGATPIGLNANSVQPQVVNFALYSADTVFASSFER